MLLEDYIKDVEEYMRISYVITKEFIKNKVLTKLVNYFKNQLFLDINIVMPKSENFKSSSIIVISLISCKAFDIEMTDTINEYTLELNFDNDEVIDLDKNVDFESFINYFFIRFVKKVFEVYNEGKMDLLYEEIENKIKTWNLNKYVAEECIHKYTREKTLTETSLITGFSESNIRNILDNYELRISIQKLKNLELFLSKLLKIKDEIVGNNDLVSESIEHIINEINNGGKNLNKREDLFLKHAALFNGMTLS